MVNIAKTNIFIHSFDRDKQMFSGSMMMVIPMTDARYLYVDRKRERSCCFNRHNKKKMQVCIAQRRQRKEEEEEEDDVARGISGGKCLQPRDFSQGATNAKPY